MQISNLLTGPPLPAGVSAVSIGARLRAWRRGLKLTQPELASELDISEDTLRRYETGASPMGASALTGLYCRGINMNWLLTGEEPMMRAIRCLETDSPEERAIQEMVLTMRELQAQAPETFRMLVHGFTARTREALRLSELEKRLGENVEAAPPSSAPIPLEPATPVKDAPDSTFDLDILTAPIPVQKP